MSRLTLLGSTSLAVFAVVAFAQAQQAAPVPPTPSSTGDTVTLPAVEVTGTADGRYRSGVTVSPDIERYALPQTRASISQEQIAETTNAIDTEDAVKYLPSLFVRKRNFGDNQPTLATRTWGVNSSARSLVYVDDVPISALISNNNTTGAPRWGMVSVEQIAGIDMLYGPFAAAYPANSMGGVLLITTRMPETFEATAKQTGAAQTFDVYKTHGTYLSSETSATIGDKTGRVSWFLSVNHLDSESQPLAFVTNGSAPAGTSGAIGALSKVGAVADVVGAGGLLHSIQDTVTARVAVDLTEWLKLTYGIGYWNNDQKSSVQTYLTDKNGNPTFGGISSFANNTGTWDESHLMNLLTLKSDTRGDWDGEVVLTRYDYLSDVQRTPAGVLTGTTLKSNGYVANLTGTGWTTADAKGVWRPAGLDGAHEISFGVHRDEYELENPTYNTPNWTDTADTGNGTLYTSGNGKTETYAAWAQEAWTFAPGFKLTVGGRLEHWRAYDGYNLAGTVGVRQPTEQSTNMSPKASLSWQISPAWTTTFSFGQAYRYPTVGELYQIVSTGSTYAIPNANLTPEDVHSYELAVERQVDKLRLRVSLFQENTSNALVQQTNLINNINTSFWQNVSAIRNRGVEFVAQNRDLFIPGLELTNSVTYVDSRIISDPNFVSTTGTTATGKHVPYVPDWRYTVQAIYRPTDDLALSTAARYSGKMYTTLDNTDKVSHVMGAFDKFLVVDAHVHYKITNVVSADVGIDNLLNEKYFEYHPFPGRTYVASAKLAF